MENENVYIKKEHEDKLLELIFTSVNTSDNVLLHRYYIELLNFGKVLFIKKVSH